jgi:hypothetical protein
MPEPMNNMKIQRLIFLIIAFLFSIAQALAQAGIVVKSSVDKNQILIGEPVVLTLEASVPENEPIRFFSIDSIPHFEFLDKGKTDTINTTEGTELKQVFRITSFDSGHWVIPSFTLSDKIATDSIPVDVLYAPFDAAQDYHDVKDIIEVNPGEKKKEWWWYPAGAGLLLLLLLIYFLTRKKTVKTALAAPPPDPYKEAMEDLDKLQKNKPAAKQYYSELTEIFRLYIFKKKNILSLQKTTDDLVAQLKTIGMGKDDFDKLSQALRLSDFVKFAKYTPSPEDDKTCLEEIRNSIMIIEKGAHPPLQRS